MMIWASYAPHTQMICIRNFSSKPGGWYATWESELYIEDNIKGNIKKYEMRV
jgi:hypothetical protein